MAASRQQLLKWCGIQLELIPTLHGLMNTVRIKVQLKSNRLAFEIGLLKTDGIFTVDAHVTNQAGLVLQSCQPDQANLDTPLVLFDDPSQNVIGRCAGGGGPEKLVDDDCSPNVKAMAYQLVIEFEASFAGRISPIVVRAYECDT